MWDGAEDNVFLEHTLGKLEGDWEAKDSLYDYVYACLEAKYRHVIGSAHI